MRKRNLLLTAVAGLLFSIATVAPAATSTVLQVEIPFSFQVKETTLPQGRYDIKVETNGLLRIEAADGSGAAAAMTIPKQLRTRPMALRPSNDSQLVFEFLEGRRVLSEVHLREGRARVLLQS